MFQVSGCIGNFSNFTCREIGFGLPDLQLICFAESVAGSGTTCEYNLKYNDSNHKWRMYEEDCRADDGSGSVSYGDDLDNVLELLDSLGADRTTLYLDLGISLEQPQGLA